MLPPYGLPDSHKGSYEGTMEALSAIRSYLDDIIKADYVLITRGDLCANIDMEALVKKHMEGDAEITCVIHPDVTNYIHHRVEVVENGIVTQLLSRQTTAERGYAMLETYVLSRKKLVEIIDWCAEGGRLHFHKDALQHFLNEGWKIATVMHEGYARHITCVDDYYESNMDMPKAFEQKE